MLHFVKSRNKESVFWNLADSKKEILFALVMNTEKNPINNNNII